MFQVLKDDTGRALAVLTILLPRAPIFARGLHQRSTGRLIIVTGVQQLHALEQRHGGNAAWRGKGWHSARTCKLLQTNGGR